ncbi:hypothetical protein [Streptomyces deserti]
MATLTRWKREVKGMATSRVKKTWERVTHPTPAGLAGQLPKAGEVEEKYFTSGPDIDSHPTPDVLSAFARGVELDSVRKHAVVRHLDTNCSQCSHAVQSIRENIDSIRRMPPLVEP